jgi:4-phytase/acid phosphatase
MSIQHRIARAAHAVAILALASAARTLSAQPADTGAKLEYVAVLSRHGSRAALVSLDTLNQYSSQPWRAMDVPVGYMTAHGRWQMQLTGTYYRQFLEQAGLLAAKPGCDEASRFYFRADGIQRDVESARAMAWAMFPDCRVAVHAPPFGAPDPLFLAATTPGLFDHEAAGAAIEGRTGGDPLRILRAHATEVGIVQKILTGDGPTPKKTLLNPPPSTGDRYTRAAGPIAAVSAITDALLLAYEEGLPPNETAWGRLDEANLPALLSLHEALVDLTWDVPLIARARGSSLLAHMLRSMQQAVGGQPVEGALGNPGDKGVFVLGHDSDFGHFATLLDLSWYLEGFPSRATPPGAAMIFEIWRETSTGHRTVRLSVLGQTIAEIRNSVAPTLQNPPMRVAVFIPGCSAPTEGFPCDWDSFRKTIEGAIDSGLVRPESLVLR